MLEKLVNFTGTAWPQARAARERKPFITKFVAPGGMAPQQPTAFFNVSAAGKPRTWATNTTAAFWRSFVEAGGPDGDADQVAQFVRRYGDPHGALTDTHAVSTSDWFGMLCELAVIAKAWEPAGADGVSRISADPVRVNDAEAWIRFRAKDFAAEFTIIPNPEGAPDLALRANTLAAFMWASATSALNRRVPMRRCDTCGTWYELQFKNALYCSGACRTAHHIQSKKG